MVVQIRSRIKEFISDSLMESIYKVCRNKLLDNNKKAALMEELLDNNGVENVLLGPGTNRVAFLIDGYVFKFAMDNWGIKDNINEYCNSYELQPYVIKTYETNGLISTCEYVTLITREEFEDPMVKQVILETLSILSQSYLLGDVGYQSKNFTNWGYRDNGDVVILDYAYLYKVRNEDLLCSEDGSLLEYNSIYTSLHCPRCHKKYSFMDLRRRISTKFESAEADEILAESYIMDSPFKEFDEDEPEQQVNKNDIIRSTNIDEPKKPEEENDMGKLYEEDENKPYNSLLNFLYNSQEEEGETNHDSETKEIEDTEGVDHNQTQDPAVNNVGVGLVIEQTKIEVKPVDSASEEENQEEVDEEIKAAELVVDPLETDDEEEDDSSNTIIDIEEDTVEKVIDDFEEVIVDAKDAVDEIEGDIDNKEDRSIYDNSDTRPDPTIKDSIINNSDETSATTSGSTESDEEIDEDTKFSRMAAAMMGENYEDLTEEHRPKRNPRQWR